jgi:hypothetical protein
MEASIASLHVHLILQGMSGFIQYAEDGSFNHIAEVISLVAQLQVCLHFAEHRMTAVKEKLYAAKCLILLSVSNRARARLVMQGTPFSGRLQQWMADTAALEQRFEGVGMDDGDGRSSKHKMQGASPLSRLLCCLLGK